MRKEVEIMEFNWHDTAREQWNERSNFWHSNSEGMWESGSRKDIIPFIKKHIPMTANILDAGCGDGYGSFKLAGEGYRVIGIDVADDMIAKAKQRGEHDGLTFMREDIGNVSFPDQSFETILAINSIEWTESPLQVLNEWKRLATDEGYLCIGILGPTAKPRVNSYDRLYGKEVICNTMMPWELEQLCNENGWELVAEQGVYKKDVKTQHVSGLSRDLKQALSFMWLFLFQIKTKSEV